MEPSLKVFILDIQVCLLNEKRNNLWTELMNIYVQQLTALNNFEKSDIWND